MPQNAVIAATGGDYTSLQAWATAEAASNYGAPTRCYISGVVPAGAIVLFTKGTNNWPNGVEIRPMAGQEYIGNNLASCARITHTSSVIEIGDTHFDMQGVYVDVTGGYNNKTVRFAANYPTTQRRNVTIKKCAIASSPNYHGATATLYLSLVSTNSGSQYHLDIEDVVVIPRVSNDGISMAGLSGTFDISGAMKRVTVTPTNTSGSSTQESLNLGAGSACTVAISSMLLLGSETRANYIDYVNSGFAGTVANIVTADSTGNITGATAATQLENFAGGDYRLKTSSHGFGAFPSAAASDQIVQSGGTAAIVRSGVAVTEISHAQVADTGAIAAIVRGGSAVSDSANTQAADTAAVAAIARSGIASSESNNAQEIDAAGVAGAVRSGTAISEWAQVQFAETGAVAAITRSGIATNTIVNETTAEQIAESGGTAAIVRAGVAGATVVQAQQFDTSGVAQAVRSGVAASESINEFVLVQAAETGGTLLLQRSGVAVSQAIVRQDVVTGGTALAFRGGVAGTVAYESDAGAGWSAPVTLFAEPLPIKQISLTFDQLGRPIVFYRVGDDTLKLYWYDPVLQQNVTQELSTGADPHAGFDFPHDTGQNFTDVMLFYVRDNAIFMRVQRDRFAVEYATPVAGEFDGVDIRSTGLRVDNRYQVVYRTAVDFTPSVHVPEVEVVGSGYYRNSWGSCFNTGYQLDVINTPFKLGFTVLDAQFPRYNEDVVRQDAFKQTQYMFGSDSVRQFYCVISRDTRNNSALIKLWRGNIERNAVFTLDDFNGVWEFEFRGLNPIVTIRKDGVVLFNDWLSTPDPSKARPTPITFAGAQYAVNNVDSYPFHGIVYNCWIESNSGRIDWAVNDKGQPTQPSVPAGTDMTIQNHRPQNWIFK